MYLNNTAKDLPVSPLSVLERFYQELLSDTKIERIIFLGGDHSLSYATTSKFIEKCIASNNDPAIIHFDAHTDLLDSRAGLPVTFGSWASHIIRQLPNPQNFVQIGIRDSQFPKDHWEQKFGHQQFWSDEVQSHGEKWVLDQINKNLKASALYVTVDIDVLDESYAPATGTRATKGLAPDMVVNIIKELSKSTPVHACDLVEIAPLIKHPGDSNASREITMLSALGIMNTLIEVTSR